jgi:hypothetical protein
VKIQVVEGKDIEGAIKIAKDVEVAMKSLTEKVGKLEGESKSLVEGTIAKSLEPLMKRMEAIEAKMAEPVFKAKVETKEDLEAKGQAQEKMVSMLSKIQ